MTDNFFEPNFFLVKTLACHKILFGQKYILDPKIFQFESALTELGTTQSQLVEVVFEGFLEGVLETSQVRNIDFVLDIEVVLLGVLEVDLEVILEIVLEVVLEVVLEDFLEVVIDVVIEVGLEVSLRLSFKSTNLNLP